MECLDCGYETTRRADWTRHLNSQKHAAIVGHRCQCGQTCSTLSNLRRHEKTCNRESVQQVAIRLAKEQATRDEILIEQNKQIIAEQRRLSAEMLEIAARPQTVMNNCTFNLATFLNETCRHAPTLEQFMSNIPICLDSEKPIGQHIVDQLSKCAVEERPIHCTDAKRGKLAVKKQENEWVQESEKIDPIMVQHVFALRMRCLNHLNEVWCRDNPNYENPENKQNDEYHQFILSIMGDLDAKFLNHVAKVSAIPK